MLVISRLSGTIVKYVKEREHNTFSGRVVGFKKGDYQVKGNVVYRIGEYSDTWSNIFFEPYKLSNFKIKVL